MKIVQLITALQLGGAEKVAIDITGKLDRNEFETTLITIFKDDSEFSSEIKNHLLEENIKWKEFGLRKKFKKLKYVGMLLSVIQIFIFLLRYKPDIVHSHTDLPDFVLSNILRIYSILNLHSPKIVRTIHNTQLWPSHQEVACYVEKMFLDDDVVFISNGAKEAYYSLRERCNLLRSENTFFISNGVDLCKYTNGCNRNVLVKHGINLSKEKVNLLFVGRFVEQKGFDLMLDTLTLLETDILDKIRICAFGSGEMELLLLQKKYATLPINIFLPTSEIHLLYGCFDFLIMPSRFEGLPLVALESFASQLLVIASNAPGLNEATPYNWPLVFENENKEALMLIIRNIVENKYDKEILGKEALSFVESKFSLDTTIQSYIDVYKDESKKNEA